MTVRRGIDASATPKHPSSSLHNATVEMSVRHELQPLTQGGLDRLCGLYSTINGIRLALAAVGAPLRQSRDLFDAGIACLERRDGLDEAMLHGMEQRRQLALARHLVRCASTRAITLTIERPAYQRWKDVEEAFAWMGTSLRESKPVLISLTGSLDHYSVVVGMTPRTLRLFDSTGISCIRRSGYALRAGNRQIAAQGLLRIAVERTP